MWRLLPEPQQLKIQKETQGKMQTASRPGPQDRLKPALYPRVATNVRSYWQM
jgi:hypothetical protein